MSFLLMTLIQNYLQAQVTLGADIAPEKGALLQLKENGDKESNSHRGLGMPRVNLTDTKNLFPMFETTPGSGTANDLYNSSTKKGDIDKKHIGLWVYNMNVCLNQMGGSEGLYVWDGGEWVRTMNNDSPLVSTFVDPRDGEIYRYARFGTAGTWMVENLRTKRLPGSNTDIPFHTGLFNPEEPAMGYPSETDWTLSTSYDENPKMGMLYNWYAATNTTEATAPGNIDQGQLSANATPGNEEVEITGPDSSPGNPYKFVKGICPDGWHLPSDREWNELEKHIYENAQLYSDYTAEEVQAWNTKTPWQPAWDFGMEDGFGNPLPGFNWRGVPEGDPNGHGYAMMAPCSPKGRTLGVSKSASQGGFFALLVGIVKSASPLYWAEGTLFWTSSSAIDPKVSVHKSAWYRNVHNFERGVKVLRYQNTRTHLVSVRCKKD